MTLKEKVAEIMPEEVDTKYARGVNGCPRDYEFLTGHYDCNATNFLCKQDNCVNCDKCWDQKYIESDDSKEAKTNNNVDHPEHYQGKHECIDVMRVMFGDEAVKGFCKCNAFKYRFRAGKKEGNSAEQDIQKAEWYEEYLFKMEDKP